MAKQTLIEYIVQVYQANYNPWLCADDIRDQLKGIHFVKSESVARCIRSFRDMFEEKKVNNYKKFRLKSDIINS